MKQKINELEVNGIIYVPKDSSSKMSFNANGLECVMIRTEAAGVHYGYLNRKEYTSAGIVVELLKCRRVWKWAGAATLSQLAVDGTNDKYGCEIPVAVPKNEMIAIEIIPMTESAVKSLNSVPVWRV